MIYGFFYGLACGVLLTGVVLVILDHLRGEPSVTVTVGMTEQRQGGKDVTTYALNYQKGGDDAEK